MPKEKKPHLGAGAMGWGVWTSQPGDGEQGWDCKVVAGPVLPAPALTSILVPPTLTAEESQVPKSVPESPAPASRPPPPQSLEGLQPTALQMGDLERAPIQNSPWKETSLDHPYERPRKSSELGSESRSEWGMPRRLGRWPCVRVELATLGSPVTDHPHPLCSSPATTPQDGPSVSSAWLLEPPTYHMVPFRSVPGQRQGRTSAPATPEMQGRRGQSQSLR